MEPGKTSFFQALGVPTKIARGTIEIITDLKLVEAGNKVGASEATLLNMLNISPFTYGMGISQIYDDGQTFSPNVLDIEESQLLGALSSAIKTIATVSLAINYPTLPSVMHSVINAYKKVLAVAIETDISWPEIEDLKDRIANPDKYAAAAPTAAEESKKEEAAPAEEKKDESEESEEEGMSICNMADGSFRAKADRSIPIRIRRAVRLESIIVDFLYFCLFFPDSDSNQKEEIIQTINQRPYSSHSHSHALDKVTNLKPPSPK